MYHGFYGGSPSGDFMGKQSDYLRDDENRKEIIKGCKRAIKKSVGILRIKREERERSIDGWGFNVSYEI